MSDETPAPFGAIRSFLWPIYRHEASKIIPMIFILFFICFNYSIVRNMKDSMVVTASGAEVIPFIKLWVMLPTAVLLTSFYSFLCNRFSQEHVFYMIVTGFLAGFALFAWVLYPMREALTPVESAEWLSSQLPSGLGGLISMYRNWTLTAFYVISELWGSMVLSVLFWGFANEVTKLSEASRFYSVFPMWLNISTIFASQVSNWVTRGNMGMSKGAVWDATLPILVTLLLVSGVMAMVAFWWTNKTILRGQEYQALHSKVAEPKKVKRRSLGFRESFSYVLNSKYLLCIATIVVAYNLSINLVEIVWKDQLRNLYPNAAEYNMFMNNLMTVTSLLSSIMALLIARIMGRYGWTKTALITPAVIFITSAGFFFFTVFNQNLSESFLAVMGMSPLAIAVLFGAAQNSLTKASKYSVFDATKEMAYIPLSHETKLKGKAAIDGVGSRLGKSGGSLIHQSLLMIFVTVSQAAPVVAIILFAAVIFWFYAVKELGIHFKDVTENGEPEAEISLSAQ